MIVTVGTFQGNAKQGLAESIGAVGYIIYAVFLVNYAAFFGYFMVPVKAGCQQLFFGMLGIRSPASCQVTNSL